MQAALLTGTVSLLMQPQRLPIKKKIEDLVSYNIALALIVPSLVESRHQQNDTKVAFQYGKRTHTIAM